MSGQSAANLANFVPNQQEIANMEVSQKFYNAKFAIF
jgi:hypothetical protein